ncbi:hypothetical protein ABW21_db0205464 [Orbilia brochopaga]|nr:hypothetical protein ABW21_db0205464 [Drechslerella brochopaga]
MFMRKVPAAGEPLRRDPRLSKRFGPDFDKNTDFVYVNPRVIAWELMEANHSLPPDHPDRDPNPWMLSPGDPREHDPLYQKEYMLIDRASLAKVKHLGLTVIPDEIALPAIELRRQIDDDEYYEEFNDWFASQRRKEERRLLRQSGMNIDEPLMITNYDDDDDDDSVLSTKELLDELRMALNGDLEPTSEYDENGNQGQVAKATKTTKTTKFPRMPAFQYQLPQVENAKFFDDSYTLMEKVVRRQLECARELSWTEESLGPDAPRFQRETIAFHKERLRILELKKISGRSTTSLLSISSNADHILFDLTSTNLFNPITNSDPVVRAYLMKGQAELLLLLDVMKAHWKRLEHLYHYSDPDYRNMSNQLGHDINKQRITEIAEGKPARNYKTLNHHENNVLELTVELVCEDLDGQLEEDLADLLQYAVFKYITATPDQDLAMRQALLVLWEAKIVGTDLRSLPQPQSKPCSCWARHHLHKVLNQYRVNEDYFGFFSKHCIKDQPLLLSLLDEDYDTDIPHALEDIELEAVSYSGEKTFIPSWMAEKHRIIPDLCREARHCFLRNKHCHASHNDHADLIMNMVWGHSHFLCRGADREAFQAIHAEIRAFIAERNHSKLSAQGENLGKAMLEYDQKLMEDRKNERVQHFKAIDEEEPQPYGKYDGGATRAKYVAVMVSGLLGVSVEREDVVDENIHTEMEEKGWMMKGAGSAGQQQKTSRLTSSNRQVQQVTRRSMGTRDFLREMRRESLERRKNEREKKAQKKAEKKAAKQAAKQAGFIPGSATKTLLRMLGVERAAGRKGED